MKPLGFVIEYKMYKLCYGLQQNNENNFVKKLCSLNYFVFSRKFLIYLKLNNLILDKNVYQSKTIRVLLIFYK